MLMVVLISAPCGDGIISFSHLYGDMEITWNIFSFGKEEGNYPRAHYIVHTSADTPCSNGKSTAVTSGKFFHFLLILVCSKTEFACQGDNHVQKGIVRYRL